MFVSLYDCCLTFERRKVCQRCGGNHWSSLWTKWWGGGGGGGGVSLVTWRQNYAEARPIRAFDAPGGGGVCGAHMACQTGSPEDVHTLTRNQDSGASGGHKRLWTGNKKVNWRREPRQISTTCLHLRLNLELVATWTECCLKASFFKM